MNPLQEFINWFNSLSGQHQGFLARIYFFLTTEDSTDLALDPRQAREKFLLLLTRQDFSPRIVARLVRVRSTMDLILENRNYFLQENNLPFNLTPAQQRKVSFLEPKQWERIYYSWLDLRARALSDQVLSRLLQKSSW